MSEPTTDIAEALAAWRPGVTDFVVLTAADWQRVAEAIQRLDTGFPADAKDLIGGGMEMLPVTLELPPTAEQAAEAAAYVLAVYDAQIRANRTPEWDTVAAVANCRNGLYGAWGEVVDLVEQLGGSLDDDDDNYTYALATAFQAYQRRLRQEITGVHEHVIAEDGDVCDCGDLVCPDCMVTVTYDADTDRYTHPAPLCSLHRSFGSTETLV
jgi:hypothetical protein